MAEAEYGMHQIDLPAWLFEMKGTRTHAASEFTLRRSVKEFKDANPSGKARMVVHLFHRWPKLLFAIRLKLQEDFSDGNQPLSFSLY